MVYQWFVLQKLNSWHCGLSTLLLWAVALPYYPCLCSSSEHYVSSFGDVFSVVLCHWSFLQNGNLVVHNTNDWKKTYISFNKDCATHFDIYSHNVCLFTNSLSELLALKQYYQVVHICSKSLHLWIISVKTFRVHTYNETPRVIQVLSAKKNSPFAQSYTSIFSRSSIVHILSTLVYVH